MQFADVLCYMFLTITVTASCVGAEEQNNIIEESQPERKISKREATVILDNYPLDRIFQKPKVIYRRISKQRYGPPKSKYGPPRPKYRPPKVTRKPGKKVQKIKPTSPKYGPPESKIQFKSKSKPNKKRNLKPKPKYGHPKARPNGRPGFGHVVKMPHYSFFVPDKTGFGEPPSIYDIKDYQPLKQSYGEPPVDSYGAPLKPSIQDVYPTAQSFQEPSQQHENQDYKRPEIYKSWNYRHAQNIDPNFAFSKKQPTYTAPTNQIFVTPSSKDSNEDSLDPDIPDKQVLQDSKFFFRKKRPFYFTDSKVLNRPWKPNKDDFDDEIIVGGQYAEPPARYVAKFPANSPVYEDDEDDNNFSPLHGYVDTEIGSSAKKSPYSNYKHSNMAFSPQNLNDAFSIVDK